jgi:hypothetical protein
MVLSVSEIFVLRSAPDDAMDVRNAVVDDDAMIARVRKR